MKISGKTIVIIAGIGVLWYLNSQSKAQAAGPYVMPLKPTIADIIKGITAKIVEPYPGAPELTGGVRPAAPIVPQISPESQPYNPAYYQPAVYVPPAGYYDEGSGVFYPSEDAGLGPGGYAYVPGGAF